MKTKHKVFSIVWIVLGVPTLYGTFVQISYKYSLQQGLLPDRLLPEWSWYVVFALCLLSGSFLIYRLPFKRHFTRNTTIAIYVGLMALALFWLSFYIACANGDCL